MTNKVGKFNNNPDQRSVIKKVIHDNQSEHSSKTIEPQILYINNIADDSFLLETTSLYNFVKAYPIGVDMLETLSLKNENCYVGSSIIF